VLPTARADIPSGKITDGDLCVRGTVREVDDTLADDGAFLYEDVGDDEFLGDFADEVALAATKVDTNITRTDASEEGRAQASARS
jgi:hypothetical protein